MSDFTDMKNRIVPRSPHTFHIPVMGTGFSIDTPLKIARFGISSVVSIVDDVIIEQMRGYHCKQNNLEYEEINERSEDSRATRITAYLNLLDKLVRKQVKELQSAPFLPGSELTRYFELLPECDLKDYYHKMLNCEDSEKKELMQDYLRSKAIPGNIDVNIMTQVDKDNYARGVKLPPEFGDAMCSLRGFANSSLASSIIFSAGLNLRLYGYISKFGDFYPDQDGFIKKKIILKVSDFRSAMIQGKFLAKKGLWVSEYRIESGLNCGGHAFATEGYLMGPILEEFKNKKEEMISTLHEFYNKGLESSGHDPLDKINDVRVTVQGGIGTGEENKFLFDRYEVDGTGWATPFLLCPEVTNVDSAHIEKLIAATSENVILSDSSPLGVPFWNLYNSASENDRRRKIELGKPGSACPKGFLKSNTEFSEIPICRASRKYQKKKLRLISQNANNGSGDGRFLKELVLVKSCLCEDLAGAATMKLGIDKNVKTSVCCGPNIVNFSKITTLEEMIGHIYDRLNIMTNPERPHMLVRELGLYVDYLKNELNKASEEFSERAARRFENFKTNLIEGVEYYTELAETFSAEQKKKFLDELDRLFEELENIHVDTYFAVATE